MKKDSSGFSLIEMTVALGISGLFVMAAASYMGLFQAKRSQLDTQAWLGELRQEITRTFRDRAAVLASMQDPANSAVFRCYMNKVDCTNAQGKFKLITRQGDAFIGTADPAPAAADQGLNFNGQVCSGFNDMSGNDACPFRYETEWRALCPAGRAHCIDPQVELKATLKFRPATRSKMAGFNPMALAVVHLYDEKAQDIDTTCASMGGTMVGGNCQLPLFSQCAPGQYILGFGDSNQLICGSPQPVQCPLGQVILGILPNGTVQCGPGCLSAGASTLPWGFGVGR